MKYAGKARIIVWNISNVSANGKSPIKGTIKKRIGEKCIPK
jgi:hypothetical protein